MCDRQTYKLIIKTCLAVFTVFGFMGLLLYHVAGTKIIAMHNGIIRHAIPVTDVYDNIDIVSQLYPKVENNSQIFNPQQRNEFSFLINNPDICSNSSGLNYLVYVHSAANHFKERHVLRTTWLNEELLRSRGISRMFLLGRYDGKDSRDVMELLLAENEIYGDLVQGDFHDSYRNISLKALMGMKWITNYCSNVKLIIKLDDDVVVDFVKLLDLLHKYETVKKTFICQIFRGNLILRDPKSCMKWCVDPSVLPGKKHFPTHCSGPLYSMTPDLPPLLYEAAKKTQFVWVDDAYLTGVLAEQVKGVRFQQNVHVWSHGKRSDKILSAWADYWKNILSKSKRSQHKTTTMVIKSH